MSGFVVQHNRMKPEKINKPTLIVSHTLLSTILSFRSTYLRVRSPKSRSQGKVKRNVFLPFFVKNAGMTPELFLNGQNGTKIENWENIEIPGITVKVAIFNIKNIKTGQFLENLLKIW